MMPHPPLSLLWVANTTPPALSSRAAQLGSIPHMQLTRKDTESLPYADGPHDHTPVLAQRVVGRGRVAATTLEVIDGD